MFFVINEYFTLLYPKLYALTLNSYFLFNDMTLWTALYLNNSTQIFFNYELYRKANELNQPQKAFNSFQLTEGFLIKTLSYSSEKTIEG